MDPIAALNTANDEFEARLAAVEDADWNLPTPCSDWNVAALVNHVLLGTRMSIQVLNGTPREEVIAQLNDDLLGESDDPVASFRSMADEMTGLFAAPDGLDGVVEHPAGDFPRSVFVGFRIGDAAAHAWDLATAIGADTSLDAELVANQLETSLAMSEMLSTSGMFGSGASGKLADDAPAQERWLDLLGRSQ